MCFWFGCSDFVDSAFALLCDTNEFRWPSFRLDEKRWKIFMPPGEISSEEVGKILGRELSYFSLRNLRFEDHRLRTSMRQSFLNDEPE
jgi:hypothetical protein